MGDNKNFKNITTKNTENMSGRQRWGKINEGTERMYTNISRMGMEV
jgi:hypothetical protein